MKKLLVKAILEKAESYKWSLQGLGMLRLYLSNEVRLHVWDDRYKIDHVSPLHTHPWNFDSEIVAGVVRQIRYEVYDAACDHLPVYNRVLIKCGANACTMSDAEQVRLFGSTLERYEEGKSYNQVADEIHESFPENGTVTAITRTFKADTEHAYVLWQGNGGFVSAEPRPATPEEVQAITKNALDRWF